MSKRSIDKHDDTITEMTIDGCGSNCTKESCPAMGCDACRGCSSCDYGDTGSQGCPQGGCDSCWLRCWRKSGNETIDMWLEDIGGLGLDEITCSLPFKGDLPIFIPQVKNTTWGVEHPAYVLNIQRFVNKTNMRWFYKRRDFRETYKLTPRSKTILTFCAEDDLIEAIWTRQYRNWGKNHNFWQGLAEYKFDAAISINYSCFSNHPRMEHVINLKRNVLTAQRLANAGIPVIMDLMWHSEVDFDRLLEWGMKNKMKWYNINCQTLKKASWTVDLIKKYAGKVLSNDPKAKVLVNGILDHKRIHALVDAFGDRISIANFGAFMHTVYHRFYSPEQNEWLRSEKPLGELWKENVEMYNNFCKGK